MTKNVLLKIFVSALLAITIIFFLDKTFFKYSAKVVHSNMNAKAVFDLDGDGYSEFCSKTNLKEGVYFEYWSKNFLKKIWRDTLKYVTQPILITDINQDNILEDYFVTINKNETFLNCIEFDTKKSDSIVKIKHTKIKLFESIFDNQTIILRYFNKDLNNDKFDEIIILAENGTERRQIIVYDRTNNKLTYSMLNAMLITNLKFFDLDKDGFLDIIFSTYANGNIPPQSITNYAETFNTQEKYYTDNNAYLGVLNQNLELKFLNKKEGFTSMYRSLIVVEKNKNIILTLESQSIDSAQIPILVKYDSNGKELLRKKMPFKVAPILLGKRRGNVLIKDTVNGEQKIYLVGISDSIIEIDVDLNFINYIYKDGMSKNSRLKRFDLDEDGAEEIIINIAGGFLIYQNEFEDELFVPIKSKGFHIFKLTEFEQNYGVYFKLGPRSGFYLKYEKNDYYYWKYLLYFAIFIGIYSVIHGIQRHGAKQLEKDNNRLELIVKERTVELSVKNEDLNIVLNKVGKQKIILEKKNKEITDSIVYAKRIQSAILPPQKLVKEYLQDSFILYKPKDIVAGDFYWMEHKDGKVLFAAADCTGHGVPGAMVSVICNGGLNRSVREYGLTDPGKILDKTREIVIKEFEKSEEDVKDGMDIALCSLEGNTLKYAGAYNPLWIIRKGKIIETKASKQPIGKFDNPTPYITHTFELIKGDSIYIFSDGFVDQFGGEKGKKFKAKAFRTLLLSVQNESMENQKTIINTAFENWKGEIEQIDDVCVIGVRL